MGELIFFPKDRSDPLKGELYHDYQRLQRVGWKKWTSSVNGMYTYGNITRNLINTQLIHVINDWAN